MFGFSYRQPSSPTTPSPQDEPKVDNDYVMHPEINPPDPSSATPNIPQEMPVR